MMDVVFLALARDCSATLPGFFQFLENMRSNNVRAFALVGENGSKDNSRALLRIAEQRGLLRVIDTKAMANEPDRLIRMARGREILKTAMEEGGPQASYVAVVDVDSVMELPPGVGSVIAALRALRESQDIFAVSATSKPHYYDLLAYDDGQKSFDNLQEEIVGARKSVFEYYKFFKNRIYSQQSHISRLGSHMVISAFNGMCIYRFGEYRTASYVCSERPGICEHLVLNRAIHRSTGKRILVDSALWIATPRDHGRQGFPEFVARRALKLARARWHSLAR